MEKLDLCHGLLIHRKRSPFPLGEGFGKVTAEHPSVIFLIVGATTGRPRSLRLQIALSSVAQKRGLR